MIRPDRSAAFSLMEVIVATAVLAASGAALFALIGQASQLARRAEMRSEALQIAQSILDETLAMPGANQTEMSGTVESNPRWDFHIEQQPVDLPSAGADSIGTESIGTEPAAMAAAEPTPSAASGEPPLAASPGGTSRLVRWTVSVFPSGGDPAGGQDDPTVRLVQWARGIPSGSSIGPQSSETSETGSSLTQPTENFPGAIP